MSNVKEYSDEQLFERIEKLDSFKGFPENYWIIGVRSNEDKFNSTDDKFYLFKGKICQKVFGGTTNAGTKMLNPSNARGMAVLAANYILYDVWEQDFHNGKVWAWCQRTKKMPISRDNDRDTDTEELTAPVWEIRGINFHPMSYIKGDKTEKSLINGWSEGCQCPSVRDDFDEVMTETKQQEFMTYCLLDEF